MSKLAIVAITRQGLTQMLRLCQQLPDVDLHMPRKYTHWLGDSFAARTQELSHANNFLHDESLQLNQQIRQSIQFFDGSLKAYLGTCFHLYQGWVFCISLGATVRLIAPYIRDKRTDPAVVVVDEAAQFAISLLSSHLGGANCLTHEVARKLGATPVVTTASDVGGTLAADMLGQEWGWELAEASRLTKVSAAVVNGESIGIIQESGEPLQQKDAFQLHPESFTFFDSLEEAFGFEQMSDIAGWILVTHRQTENLAPFLQKGILYRPKSLVLGIGCSRGTKCEELEAFVTEELAKAHLSLSSVGKVASITLKQDEDGLLQWSSGHGWPIQFFSPEKLNLVPIPQPSEVVFQVTGTYGVSQAAAMLAAGSKQLIVEKVKCHNITLSVALQYPR